MKAWVPVLIAFSVLGATIYGLSNSFNPNSWWCLYQIYKEPDGHYEVWWSCRSRHFEGTFDTYESAKSYQVSRCKSLESFMMNSPNGKRVK